MGWRGNVIFKDTFTLQELVGERRQTLLLDEIREWADAHGADVLWEAVRDSTYHIPTGGYCVMIRDAKIPQEELEGVKEFFKIAEKDAYLGSGTIYVEENKPAPEKKPVSVTDIIEQALQMLSPEEQQKLMDMKLGDILHNSKNGCFNKSKLFVLANGHKINCPVCGSPGKIRVIDSELLCGYCNHSWGDIDELPDFI